MGVGCARCAGGVIQRRIRSRGQGFGGGAGGLEDAFGGDVGAAEGGVEVGGFECGAGGVERDDGVAAAVLQPADDVAEGAGGVEGGGEQGAGEDLFAGGVEERVAAGAADGGHEVPGQPGGGFDPVGVGDLADRAQGVPPPLSGGGRRCLAGRTPRPGPSSARDPLVSAHRSALLEVATARPGAARTAGTASALVLFDRGPMMTRATSSQDIHTSCPSRRRTGIPHSMRAASPRRRCGCRPSGGRRGRGAAAALGQAAGR